MPDHHQPPPEVLRVQAIAQCLYDQQEVLRAIDQLAVRVSLDLAQSNPVLLCVMNGALPFAGALLTRLHFPLCLDFLQVSRYRDSTAGQTLRWLHKPETDLANRDVLLLDDVLDEGKTLSALLRFCEQAGARSTAAAVLARKAVPGVSVRADYIGLECPNRFLLGWGMDYKGYLRNLSGIYALPKDQEQAFA
ncbi:MAG: hypoxanthine-guanine phosphoribosyltransferase [Pseudomonadales bacterium]